MKNITKLTVSDMYNLKDHKPFYNDDNNRKFLIYVVDEEQWHITKALFSEIDIFKRWKDVLVDSCYTVFWKELKLPSKEERIEKGDYVLATKYSDGDSKDHWVVGFFNHKDRDRYMIDIYDDNYNLINARATGFRKIKKITRDFGDLILKNKHQIESSNVSLWEYHNGYKRNKTIVV